MLTVKRNGRAQMTTVFVAAALIGAAVSYSIPREPGHSWEGCAAGAAAGAATGAVGSAATLAMDFGLFTGIGAGVGCVTGLFASTDAYEENGQAIQCDGHSQATRTCPGINNQRHKTGNIGCGWTLLQACYECCTTTDYS